MDKSPMELIHHKNGSIAHGIHHRMDQVISNTKYSRVNNTQAPKSFHNPLTSTHGKGSSNNQISI